MNPEQERWSHAKCFEALVEMRGDLNWNPYRGGYWTASAQTGPYNPDDGMHAPGVNASGADPVLVVMELHAKWQRVGCGYVRQPYTEAEVAAVHEKLVDFKIQQGEEAKAERSAKSDESERGAA